MIPCPWSLHRCRPHLPAFLFPILIVVLLASPAFSGETYRVPADFPTIPEAVAFAGDGDTILVAPGYYPDAVVVDRKRLRLLAEDPSVRPRIGYPDSTWALLVQNGASLFLDGFEISGTMVAGVEVYDSRLRMTRCDVHHCGGQYADFYPDQGGVYVSGSSELYFAENDIHDNYGIGVAAYFYDHLEMVGNRIYANVPPSPDFPASTGGVRLTSGIFLLRRNWIHHNESKQGGGIYVAIGGDFYTDSVIADNVIAFNEALDGGGIYLDSSAWYLDLQRNTLWDNSGGGVFVRGSPCCISLENSILWANGREIEDESGVLLVRYCDIEGSYPGEGNIDVAPLLENPEGLNFRPSPESPCINRADPVAIPAGLDLDGWPRILDGDLDHVLRLDIGCAEFSHVGLTITGDFSAGGQITMESTGTPGLPFSVFAGLATGEVLLPRFGSLFLDLAAPWFMIPWLGVLPDQRVVQLPPDSLPLDLVVQDLAIDPARGCAGTLSNPVPVRIR